MAERIVSPGVFTREKDLSFLPAGVAQIGAAIVGPTMKGPSFVPTLVRSFEEFENLFGSYSTDYYTPYAVREYFRGNAGSVTIVKVGYIGGYSAPTLNLLVSGSGTTKFVAATFAPAAGNGDGLGSISGSLTNNVPSAASGISASSATINLMGANTTASLTLASVLEGQSGTLFSETVGRDPLAPKIGATEAPQYLFKHFRTAVADAVTAGTIDAQSFLIFESQSAGADFNSGGETVNSTTYVSTINGSKDATAARTPFIQSQAPAQDLFKIYSRVDGAASNNLYVVVRDVKAPSNSNSSPDYAQFGIDVYELRSERGVQLESYSNLNLDPASPNYLPKVIGDQFQTVTAGGEVVLNGEYANLSRYVRVGDYDEKVFTGNKRLQPMGFAPVIEPIIATANVPAINFATSQAKSSDASTYNGNVPYGFKIDESYFNTSELYTNKEYMSAIPASADAGQNVAFALENMTGFGDTQLGSDLQGIHGSSFKSASMAINVNTAAIQLKFAVPMQYGFDGDNPSVEKKTGGDILATNTMGFDCSASDKSGSVAYKRAINAVGNPDEIDINMLVTPGILHSLHSAVTNHAIDKVESRADAFYVMDAAQWGDNVQSAVSNVQTLDTNYAATYYPWVKMDDPSTGTGVWVPPSVVIPGVMAFTDSVAHEWFAPAGLNRGGLTSVRIPKKKLTHTDRDTLYEGRVNPIATFPGQGVVVFGQKTLQAKPSALDRINVRRLLIRLKKFIASSSRFLVFEQNDSSTRARFLNIVNPFLESVQANSGLSAFKVVMDDSNNTPDVIDRNQMVGQIFIQPTRTAEFIVLDFSVLPTGAAFPE
jgi:phage tail sheath protein FI